MVATFNNIKNDVSGISPLSSWLLETHPSGTWTRKLSPNPLPICLHFNSRVPAGPQLDGPLLVFFLYLILKSTLWDEMKSPDGLTDPTSSVKTLKKQSTDHNRITAVRTHIALEDHTVLAQRHSWPYPSKAGTRFGDPGGMLHLCKLMIMICTGNVSHTCLQCFDAVGWVAGRTFGL